MARILSCTLRHAGSRGGGFGSRPRPRSVRPNGPTPEQSGIYLGTLADLVDLLEEARAADQLKQRLKTLAHLALLGVEEIGYFSVTPSGAKLFVQLVNARYGHASTVLTASKEYEHRGEILHDEVMAAALLCRLLHRCHIVNIRGNSYRMRRQMELLKAIHPRVSRTRDAQNARQREGS